MLYVAKDTKSANNLTGVVANPNSNSLLFIQSVLDKVRIGETMVAAQPIRRARDATSFEGRGVSIINCSSKQLEDIIAMVIEGVSSKPGVSLNKSGPFNGDCSWRTWNHNIYIRCRKKQK